MRAMISAAAAIGAIVLSNAGDAEVAYERLDRPLPPTRRKQARRREHHPRADYTPKIPSTPADFERLRAAQAKRERKAAKRALIAERGGYAS